MPQIPSGLDVSAAGKGTVADHRTLGANMTVPMMYGLKEQYRLTERFLKNRIMTLQIVAPRKSIAGSDMEFVVRLANTGVGHTFPAGPEADLIEAWTEVTVRAEDGRTLFHYGALDAKGHLDDRKTYVYRIYPVGADGKPLELDRHRTWMFAEDKLHVIPAMQYDETPFRFKLPLERRAQRLQIEARLRFRKHNQGFVDWLVGEGNLTVPIVDMARDSAAVEVIVDAALAREASQEWLARLEKPQGLDGLKMKPRFDGSLIGHKLTLADALVMGRAQQAFKNARYMDSLSILRTLSPAARRLPHIIRLEKGLEQSAKERAD